jgi:hypothetical protein
MIKQKMSSHKIITMVCLLALCATAVVSCKKKVSTVDIDLGKDYFPLETGRSITYTMDSTIYDDFLGVVYTNRYIIQDRIDSSFTDLLGNQSFVVVRYIRPDSGLVFAPMHVYYVTKSNQQIQVVENNQRFIKLVFPVSYTGVWLGNSYIATSSSDNSWLSDWRYKYADFGVPYTVNDTAVYGNTITVNQRNNAEGDTSTKNTFFGAYTFGKEIYARNVGLVYRSLIRWKKDPAIGGGKRRGYALEFKAIDYN